MRENLNIDAVGTPDQLVDRCAEDAGPPSRTAAMSNIDLCDSMLRGEVQNDVDRICLPESLDVSAGVPRGFDVPAQLLLVRLCELRLLNVNREQLALESS